MNVCTDVRQAIRYYLASYRTADYYTEGHEIVGTWGGKGAELLGLSGEIDCDDYIALCENRRPKSQDNLTARTKATRTVGMDMTMDVPKSVSITHAVSGDKRIVQALQESADGTMQLLQDKAATRTRKGGVKDGYRPSGNLTWACFTHYNTRPLEDGIPDPQLHVHMFTFNATLDPVEKEWKAVQFYEIVNNAPFYQSYFHDLLAKKLQALGYVIERRGIAFEIVGVPESVNRQFSRRTQLINKIAAERGITDPDEKGKLGAATRNAKNSNLSPRQIAKIAIARMSAADLAAVKKVIRDAAVRLKHPEKDLALADGVPLRDKPLTQEEESAIRYAILHSFEKASVRTELQFMGDVLKFGVGHVDFAKVKAHLPYRQDLVYLDRNGQQMLTTPQVIREEQEIVSWTKAGMKKAPALVPHYRVQADWLSPEQKAAVEHLLTSQDRVTGVTGRAGTGKTTLMKVAVGAMESRGHQVLILTPRAKTAYEVLPKEGFKNTETVAQLLANEKLQMEFSGGVWWVDEAGQLSVPDMHRLFTLAQEYKARIILSGDIRQHGSVQRGDALRILQEHADLNLVQIRQIQRQKGLHKVAVEHLAEGRVLEGLQIIDSLHWIHEITNEERYLQLARDYLQAVDDGDTALVIAPTHAECRRVTEQIRAKLKERGDITGAREVWTLREINLTEAQQRDARTYRPGFVIEMIRSAPGLMPGERFEVTQAGSELRDGIKVRHAGGDEKHFPVHQYGDRFRVYEKQPIELGIGEPIRITKNGWSADERYRLHNGSLPIVAGFTANGGIALDTGVVLSRNFAHLTHGYAATSQAGQGQTVDQVFIALSTESLGAISMEQVYVAISRARKSSRMYTNDKEDVFYAAQRSSQRMSALELAQAQRSLPLDHEDELREAQKRAERNITPLVPAEPVRQQQERMLPPEPPAKNLRWQLGHARQVQAIKPQSTTAISLNH